MFMNADVVVKAVMVGLVFASIVTWAVCLAKTIELLKARRRVRSGYSWGRWDGDLTFDPGTGPIVVFDPSHRKIDANGWLAGGRSGSTISSTPLYLGSKPMRRGQTSKAAEASTQSPAT
jgi:hypothetical protein